jgi:hypothetical protein
MMYQPITQDGKKKMIIDLDDAIFDVMALHGRDIAIDAVMEITKTFLNSKTQTEICDRRDKITAEIMGRKEGA